MDQTAARPVHPAAVFRSQWLRRLRERALPLYLGATYTVGLGLLGVMVLQAADAWTGSRWSDSAWSGSRWSGSRWSGSRWSGSRWSGSRWSGSRWSSTLEATQRDGFLTAFWGQNPPPGLTLPGEVADTQ